MIHLIMANLPEYLLGYRVNPWSMTATYEECRLGGPQVSVAPAPAQAAPRIAGCLSPATGLLELGRTTTYQRFGSG